MLSSSLGAGKIGCWNSLFCLYCQSLFCHSNKTSEWCFLTVLMNDKEGEVISKYLSFVFCPTHHHVQMGKAANNCSILKYGGQVLQGSLQWLVLQVAQLRELRVWNTMNQNNLGSWSEIASLLLLARILPVVTFSWEKPRKDYRNSRRCLASDGFLPRKDSKLSSLFTH